MVPLILGKRHLGSGSEVKEVTLRVSIKSFGPLGVCGVRVLSFKLLE